VPTRDEHPLPLSVSTWLDHASCLEGRVEAARFYCGGPDGKALGSLLVHQPSSPTARVWTEGCE
jgi:hypothetical protein